MNNDLKKLILAALFAALSCVATMSIRIPANIIQGVGGLVISCILYPILISIPNVRQMTVATR